MSSHPAPAGPKTDLEHWEARYQDTGGERLPLPFSVGTLNLKRLLRPHLAPGRRLIELGCAPGRILAWAAKHHGVLAAGIDYSPQGVRTTRRLFETLSLPVDVRCEDAFRHTFPDRSFDIVYSCGLIEHFEDPGALVAKHAALLAPGGVALIAIPNYGGVFGRIQARFHPENLTVHNLAIMTPQAMVQLAPHDPEVTARAYRFGRLSPGLVTWRAGLPGPVARLVWHALNAAGILQPFDIPALAPHLVLELQRG